MLVQTAALKHELELVTRERDMHKRQLSEFGVAMMAPHRNTI